MDLESFCGRLLEMMFSAVSNVSQQTARCHRTDSAICEIQNWEHCDLFLHIPWWFNKHVGRIFRDKKWVKLDSLTYQTHRQEPILVWPAAFMNILTEIPRVPRPLKVFDADRVKKLLQLAGILLDIAPTESTQRTIRYFIKLCDSNQEPDELPALRWISTRVPGEYDALEQLDLSNCRPAERLMPQMRFMARLGRPRWKKILVQHTWFTLLTLKDFAALQELQDKQVIQKANASVISLDLWWGVWPKSIKYVLKLLQCFNEFTWNSGSDSPTDLDRPPDPAAAWFKLLRMSQPWPGNDPMQVSRKWRIALRGTPEELSFVFGPKILNLWSIIKQMSSPTIAMIYWTNLSLVLWIQKFPGWKQWWHSCDTREATWIWVLSGVPGQVNQDMHFITVQLQFDQVHNMFSSCLHKNLMLGQTPPEWKKEPTPEKEDWKNVLSSCLKNLCKQQLVSESNHLVSSLFDQETPSKARSATLVLWCSYGLMLDNPQLSRQQESASSPTMRWLRPRIVHSHSKPKAHPSNPTPRDCQAQILMGKNYISNERKVYELGSIFTRACHRLCDLHAEDTQWAETKRRWVKKNWRSRVTKCHKHLWGFQMPLKGYSTWWPWLRIITYVQYTILWYCLFIKGYMMAWWKHFWCCHQQTVGASVVLWLNRRILATGFSKWTFAAFTPLDYQIQEADLWFLCRKWVPFPCSSCAQESCCPEAGCSCSSEPSTAWQARQSNHIQLTLDLAQSK